MSVMSTDCDILHRRGKSAGCHQNVVLPHNQARCTDREASVSSNGAHIYLPEHLYSTFLSDTYSGHGPEPTAGRATAPEAVRIDAT